MVNGIVKQIMDEMCYGLYIVGSKDGEADGMMADWVMQVSFSPRLVAVAFENDARTLANIRRHGTFSLNFLSQEAHGMAVAQKFAQPYMDEKVRGRTDTAVKVHHKLDGVAYKLTPRDTPVLDDAMAWLECEAEQFVPAGDHTLVIARIVEGELRQEAEPLTSAYTGWNYSG